MLDFFGLNSRSIKLTLLDEHHVPVGNATGFFLQGADGVYLCTCWHVVTGIDFLDIKVKQLPIRRKVAFQSQKVEQPNEYTQVIGGGETVILSLYSGDNKPLWRQEKGHRPHADLNSVNLFVPKFCDLVTLKVDLPSIKIPHITWENKDIYSNLAFPGTDVLIVGYPYGYSTLGPDFPSPIMIKRTIAGIPENPYVSLLDGGCSPGMSGSPVYYRDGNKYWLHGIYTGTTYPDFNLLENSRGNGQKNDKFAALGLTNISLATKSIFKL